MHILFNDLLQNSNSPATLISPALADITTFQTLDITLESEVTFSHVGLGYTNASSITINGQTINIPASDKNGLYLLVSPITAQVLNISFPSISFIGRLAIGIGRKLGASPAMEPGMYTTITSRVTKSGQVIPGVGGVSGDIYNLDFRYKIDKEIYDDIKIAYPTQLARMFPLFMMFDGCSEQLRFPRERFYGYTDPQLLFQGSVRKFLYSKKFRFKEAY